METVRVYLVDDNDAFRESTSWLLETAGFDVAAFASGPEFLAAFAKDARHGPACLVSDMRMPQMSGLQLQEELLRLGNPLPLVFVTAHGDVPLAVEAMRKGASNFLEKPFGEDALVEGQPRQLAVEIAGLPPGRPGGDHFRAHRISGRKHLTAPNPLSMLQRHDSRAARARTHPRATG